MSISGGEDSFFISEEQIDHIIEQLAQEQLPADPHEQQRFHEDRVAIYRMVFSNVISSPIPGDHVIPLWNEIMLHKYLMSEKLGRNVGFRVATLDYLFNIRKRFSNPTILENREYEQLISAAQLDFKTGIFNARTIYRTVDQEIDRSRRYGLYFALVLLDMDNFKAFNDSQGHLTGDELLKRFAEHSRETLRGIDVPARFGGDEFCILLPQTHSDTAMAACDRLQQGLEELQKEYFPTSPPVTLSGGVAMFPFDGCSRRVLFAEADKALYQAKDAGRNRILPTPERLLEPVLRTSFLLKCNLSDQPHGFSVQQLMLSANHLLLPLPEGVSITNQTELWLTIQSDGGSERHVTKTRVQNQLHKNGRTYLQLTATQDKELLSTIIRHMDFDACEEEALEE